MFMESKSQQLPEKIHYQVDEFCRLLNIDRETLDQYAFDMGVIRYALPSRTLGSSEALRLTDDEYVYLSTELLHYDLFFHENEIFWPDEVIQSISFDRFNITEIREWLYANCRGRNSHFETVEIPKYVYILPHVYHKINGKIGCGENYHLFFEDFEQNKLMLIEDNNRLPFGLSQMLPVRDAFCGFETKVVITREERDRFLSGIQSQAESDHSLAGGHISPKSRNVFIRTIRALSEALIDGLTGKPYPDAEAILRALELKGIDAPISSRKLAEYLKESENLP
jgi:hypothetical protein